MGFEVDAVVNEDKPGTEEGADYYTKEGEGGKAAVPVAVFAEGDGEGLVEEKKNTVNEGLVDC